MVSQWFHRGFTVVSPWYHRGFTVHGDGFCAFSAAGPLWPVSPFSLRCLLISLGGRTFAFSGAFHGGFFCAFSAARPSKAAPWLFEYVAPVDPAFDNPIKSTRCAWIYQLDQGTNMRSLIQDVISQPEVRELRNSLLRKANLHGEWEVIQHDASYKALFSLLGQEAMAQMPGEAHALHSFLGKTGACPGLAAEKSEGLACFKSASCKALPLDCRAQTRMIFSDSPSGLERCTDIYPNLEGLAADPLHLAIRVEATSGERRTPLSRRLLALHAKFLVPTEGQIYHGSDLVHGPAGVWDLAAPCTRGADHTMRRYFEQPYENHQQYINDLMDAVEQYKDEIALSRTNAKGKTTLQIIQNAAAYEQYAYLQHGSVLRGRRTAMDRELLGWGTASNEALHKEVKTVFAVVTHQHESSMQAKTTLFSINKLLAHNSAAYWGTTIQRKQPVLLAMIHGSIERSFFAARRIARKTVDSQKAYRVCVTRPDAQRKEEAQRRSAREKIMWQREVERRKKRACGHSTPSSKRKKRIVFTRKKSAPLRRKPASCAPQKRSSASRKLRRPETLTSSCR